MKEKLQNSKANDKTSLNYKQNKVMLSKPRKKSLEEIFEYYKGENLAKCFLWDEPKGKEIW